MKLSPQNEALLETFKENAIKNNVIINEEQFEALSTVYHAITKRVLSKGCSTCVPDAFKIIRNYIALYPDPVPKVLSKNTKKLKPIVKEEDIPEEVLEVFKEVQEDFTTPKLIKEIKKDEPKKKTPAKKKTVQKSNAKASPRNRRKRK